jgi:alkylhydroperoxidase family enzyme
VSRARHRATPSKRHLDRLGHAALDLHDAVLESDPALTSASTSGQLRRDAYNGVLEEPVLARYVAMVREHAYRVTDADIKALRAYGLSDDAIFELTVAAALGEAQRRLAAGLALLDPAAGQR